MTCQEFISWAATFQMIDEQADPHGQTIRGRAAACVQAPASGPPFKVGASGYLDSITDIVPSR
ncbi:hypothetical protein I546_2645 [Mycobacterium kansasii 732]|uniref:Uncharacterized protein n=1 Tax=Mycobacterium pseudokansasii TaxID=2341080 RepID=A0A498QQK4_9MYCO|nr:hypothetical protein I546_2645 [Mycobacterium kansasii 732]VAZ93872.1 hypothetical protein LAUMK35_02447 [Mycobacterium pseudokansasii]VAZ94852.1 hypothetical protein LAUMK21_02448 [Mycobacterium pseudokansasii]VBA50049.1 hypothetical protein LAUMK142_02338 [Mycobacterium pseudokansasii]